MALAPEIASFGDGDHQQGETGLTISGGGFGAFPGNAWIYQNADRSGLSDQLIVGAWNDIELSGVDIPASTNNGPGTVYLFVQREDLAWSQGFQFTLAAGQFLQSIAGSIASSGALTKQTARALLGSIASAGSLSGIKAALLSIAGSLASSGALTRRTGKAASGAVSTAGTLTKSIGRTFTATITSSGALQSLKTALISLSGALSSAGTLTRRIEKSLSGSVTAAGSVIKSIALSLAGALASAGGLSTSTSGPAQIIPPQERTIYVRRRL